MPETTWGGPRTAARPAGPAALRLSRPTARAFPGRRPARLAGTELRFMTDFLASFGEEPDHERHARGGGNSFTDMARELLDGLEHPLPPLDRLVLAYHLPDLSVVEVAGCYLAERCPGGPEVFSVAGQGVGAPFTALRILAGLRRTGGLAEGAVLVLDQSTLPYADPDTRPGDDCAVLVHTAGPDAEAGGPAGDGPAGDGTAPGDAELDFVTERSVDPNTALGELARQAPGVRIVAGRMLADRLDPALRASCDLVEGAADRLCTSAWAALAEHWTPDRYTVIADYDPHSGRLFQAGLRPGAAA
ncbi:hypothetical protein PUR61_38205 [Streptomyces sp. BE20]|uniref:hypothetical protein n=1 Tax=Streptomyces sp. BE20 TaxID=3002525 RepID=UPI002E76130D|nr:hypothetical protein [Streptomyces sp. BE20]MEE1827970.1 hypothetical protein [Streptomyces sp. BE20]